MSVVLEDALDVGKVSRGEPEPSLQQTLVDGGVASGHIDGRLTAVRALVAAQSVDRAPNILVAG